MEQVKTKFSVGDRIEALFGYPGFEKATILSIFKETKGVHKGKNMYLLKIVNGTATIPVSAEVNYQLIKNKK